MSYFGFNASALKIEDKTDIMGYFQTEKYFDNEKVRQWYAFREEKISCVKEKYKSIDFSEGAGLHLRLGDKQSDSRYFILPVSYYSKALSKIKYKKNIFIFSDEINLARQYLEKLKGNIIYIEGNKNFEDLYLMSLCRDFICSGSTLSWWGAWLISYTDKTVVVPKEGPTRKGAPIRNNEFWPQGYLQINALRGFLDDYRVLSCRQRVANIIKRVKAICF